MRLKLQALFCSFLVVTSTASVAHAQYPNRESGSTNGPTAGWQKLGKVGPGRTALVSLNDGTLRSGWIAGVSDDHLQLQGTGKTIDLAASDIASVRVKRSDRTLIYGVLGYLITATVASVVVYNDDDHEAKDLIVVFGVGGIPGGLLGAAIGHRTSGDVEIIP